MNLTELLKSKNVIGATLLVTGCCIGAGMIGLPVLSALAGFMPSSVAMVFCYLFTTFTGLLLLEATLWFDNKVNLLSITEFALGKFGKMMTWMLFLFLFYCLFVAYLDGGGQLFADMLSAVIKQPVPKSAGIVLCGALVGIISYAGTRLVDGINRYLLIGLVVSYCVLVMVGMPNVKSTNLAHINLTAAIATVPILLICFGYQNLVPSITYYLNKNIKAIRFAIVIGNLLPFFIYFVWNFVILGSMPAAEVGMNKNADMITSMLQNISGSASIIFYVKAFSLFAILTSFLPNAVSFMDFLKDGFRKSKVINPDNEAVLYCMVFLPPMACALYYPHMFLNALSFAGGFIDVLLYGVLPATVVLIGRNVKKIAGPYQVIGGTATPVFILIISAIVLYLKVH